MRKYLRDYSFLLMLSGLIVIFDRLTKELVRENLSLGGTWSPWEWLSPFVRIVNWKNSGAAFGLGQSMSSVITVLAFFVAIAIVYYFPKVPRSDWPLRIAMGMQLGGALGNLVDRLDQGFVTDFISVGSFPVFNVADASISVGVAVLVLGVWIQERRRKEIPVLHDETSLVNENLPSNSEFFSETKDQEVRMGD